MVATRSQRKPSPRSGARREPVSNTVPLYGVANTWSRSLPPYEVRMDPGPWVVDRGESQDSTPKERTFPPRRGRTHDRRRDSRSDVGTPWSCRHQVPTQDRHGPTDNTRTRQTFHEYMSLCKSSRHLRHPTWVRTSRRSVSGTPPVPCRTPSQTSCLHGASVDNVSFKSREDRVFSRPRLRRPPHPSARVHYPQIPTKSDLDGRVFLRTRGTAEFRTETDKGPL